MSEIDEEQHEMVDGARVILETIPWTSGWALFTGCEGDSPEASAFFLYREDGEAYIRSRSDPDADNYLCDPDRARLRGHVVHARGISQVGARARLLPAHVRGGAMTLTGSCGLANRCANCARKHPRLVWHAGRWWCPGACVVRRGTKART